MMTSKAESRLHGCASKSCGVQTEGDHSLKALIKRSGMGASSFCSRSGPDIQLALSSRVLLSTS